MQNNNQKRAARFGLYLLGMLLALGLTLNTETGVGRSIAAFNALCKRPLLRAAGLEPVRA